MRKAYYFYIVVIATILLSSCVSLIPANAFRAAPDSDLAGNFNSECLHSFDFSKNQNADEGRCEALTTCLRESMSDTILLSHRIWPTVEKIMPYSSGRPLSIVDMRANAEKAGPQAIQIFNVIYDIRKQCIINTSLDDIMLDV